MAVAAVAAASAAAPLTAASLPAEFRNQAGNISADKTIPALKSFVENGGIIITIGSSTSIAAHLDLPGERSARRAEPGRHGARARQQQVLRAGLAARSGGGQHRARRARHGQPRRGDVRQQPRLPARAGRGGTRACVR